MDGTAVEKEGDLQSAYQLCCHPLLGVSSVWRNRVTGQSFRNISILQGQWLTSLETLKSSGAGTQEPSQSWGGGLEPILTHFFPCNVIGLMLGFDESWGCSSPRSTLLPASLDTREISKISWKKNPKDPGEFEASFRDISCTFHMLDTNCTSKI